MCKYWSPLGNPAVYSLKSFDYGQSNLRNDCNLNKAITFQEILYIFPYVIQCHVILFISVYFDDVRLRCNNKMLTVGS